MSVANRQGERRLVPTPTCLEPPVFCGAAEGRDLDPCAGTGVVLSWPEAIDAGSAGPVFYDIYRDDVLIASALTGTGLKS